MTRRLVVRSNVRRDLLQSAQLFRNEKLVIWEYVSNSLQYVDMGVVPRVDVTIDNRQKRIVIADNGRGMDLPGLQNFFVMHGENQDRLAGRRGRGRFGTGKSAAFGIGRLLRLTSIRNGRRSRVELSRNAIDAAGDDEIPIEILEANEPTDEANGTTIEIEDVRVRRMDPPAVIRYLERHLTRWQGRPFVSVNAHECEPHEPTVVRTAELRSDEQTSQVTGPLVLVLKVASAPLDAEQQGVAVFADGVWLTTTLAGCDGQPMVNYIFGDVDVPSLDDESESIPAFDMSRSMQLNPENRIVQILIPFLGRAIDALRRELVREDRERRAQAEAQRLQREGDRIAALINDDFADYNRRLARIQSRGGGGRDAAQVPEGAGNSDVLIRSEHDIPGELMSGTGESSPTTGPSLPNPEPIDPPDKLLWSNEEGRERGHSGATGKRRPPRGGFRVEFENQGEQEPRARYVREARAIYINLDHPQMRAVRGTGSINEVMFQRLAYEVAFAEYAIALAQELAALGDYNMDPTDAIFEIRETMNRMAVKSASLYEDSTNSEVQA